jgi:cold shock CspA family protein
MNDRIKIVCVRDQIAQTNDWKVELLSRQGDARLPGDLQPSQTLKRNQLLAVTLCNQHGTTFVERVVKKIAAAELPLLAKDIRESSRQRFSVYDATFKRFNRVNDYGFAARMSGAPDIFIPGHALRRSGLSDYIFAPSQTLTVLAFESAKGPVAIWIGVES